MKCGSKAFGALDNRHFELVVGPGSCRSGGRVGCYIRG